MQQPPESPPFATLAYRVDVVEQDVKMLQAQMQTYVPQRENELQLRSIRETVGRIEQDVKTLKDDVKTITDLVAAGSRSQDKLLIRILWGAISVVVAILIGVAIFYLTHLP